MASPWPLIRLPRGRYPVHTLSIYTLYHALYKLHPYFSTSSYTCILVPARTPSGIDRSARMICTTKCRRKFRLEILESRGECATLPADCCDNCRDHKTSQLVDHSLALIIVLESVQLLSGQYAIGVLVDYIQGKARNKRMQPIVSATKRWLLIFIRFRWLRRALKNFLSAIALARHI